MKAFVIGCIAAASLFAAGCRSNSVGASAAPQTEQARVSLSQLQQAPVTVSATGTLHAHETAILSAQVVGRIEQVLVHEGDLVKAGQALAVLDDTTLRASAEQADAAVNAAKDQQAAAQTNADLNASTLARYKQLQAEKSVSPQEMDEVVRRAEASSAQLDALKAQERAAEAQAGGAHAMLGYAHIRAPFAGVVTARMVDPGAMAAPGVPLLQIDSAGPLQLQTAIDESTIGAVHLGMKIPVRIGNASSTGSGTISQIVPAADPASHSFMVKIDLPPMKDLHAGTYATAEIATGTRAAILAPATAIVQRGSLSCAYVVASNGIAELRYVTPGATHDNLVELLSGVSAGEKLVDDPADRDLAGKRIEVQP